MMFRYCMLLQKNIMRLLNKMQMTILCCLYKIMKKKLSFYQPLHVLQNGIILKMLLFVNLKKAIVFILFSLEQFN